MIVIVSLFVFFFAGGSESLEKLDLGRAATVDSLEAFSFHAAVPSAVYSATVRMFSPLHFRRLPVSRAVANRDPPPLHYPPPPPPHGVEQRRGEEEEEREDEQTREVCLCCRCLRTLFIKLMTSFA